MGDRVEIEPEEHRARVQRQHAQQPSRAIEHRDPPRLRREAIIEIRHIELTAAPVHRESFRVAQRVRQVGELDRGTAVPRPGGQRQSNDRKGYDQEVSKGHGGSPAAPPWTTRCRRRDSSCGVSRPRAQTSKPDQGHLPDRTSSRRTARPDPGSLIPQAPTSGGHDNRKPARTGEPPPMRDGTALDSRIVGGGGCTISGRTCGTG